MTARYDDNVIVPRYNAMSDIEQENVHWNKSLSYVTVSPFTALVGGYHELLKTLRHLYASFYHA